MKYLKIAVLLVFSLVSLCSSCLKDHLAGKFLLTDEIKSQNPFTGGEKLYYISDSSASYIFSIALRNDQIHEQPAGINTNEYYLIEVDQTSTAHDSIINKPELFLEMAGRINRAPNFRIDFSFSTKGRSWSFDLPLSIERTPFIDSLEIQGKWYYDVYQNELDKLDNRAYKLYYSTKFGIVKIDFSDGSYWELEKIEWTE